MLNNYESNCAQYHIISPLGQCCQGVGTVFLAKHLISGQMVAIKKFNMDKVKEDSSLIEQEIILTRQLQHPNIVKYLIAFVSGVDVCVVSPLMGYGSCRDLLNMHFSEGFPENAIALTIKSVVDAVEYIHKKGIIHRALRASHVLISAKGVACLSGFRYSCPIIKDGKWQRQIYSFPSSTASNLNWLSPELLQQNLQGYNEKSDVYSLGMLLCELANGTEPFAGVSTTLMLTEKVRGCMPQLLDCSTLPEEEIHGDSGIRLTFQNQACRKFSDGLHEITALCLQKEPHHRPSASQLLNHSFFKVNRRGLLLTELLKPAMPLSDAVAYNSDVVESFENVQRLSELDILSYDWDF